MKEKKELKIKKEIEAALAAEGKRLDAIGDAREALLQPYSSFVSPGIPLSLMEEDDFEKLLAGARDRKEAEDAEAKTKGKEKFATDKEKLSIFLEKIVGVELPAFEKEKEIEKEIRHEFWKFQSLIKILIENF